jgi:uncharacterized protein (UPF0333 family)
MARRKANYTLLWVLGGLTVIGGVIYFATKGSNSSSSTTPNLPAPSAANTSQLVTQATNAVVSQVPGS